MERHEAKYIIHPSQVAPIRDFIRPFCIPDPFARGDPPEYVVTTLYLDTPELELYRASIEQIPVRFKLRVRTYVREDRSSPVFVEIKRKVKGMVFKSRSAIPPALWRKEICQQPDLSLPFRSPGEKETYLEFTGLVTRLGARPVMLVRYQRECYYPAVDEYARVTFDRRLSYRPATSFRLPGPGDKWRKMDSSLEMGWPFSGMILELKSFRDVPLWMVELTERFDLTRVGFCKYANAMCANEIFNDMTNVDCIIEEMFV